MFVSMIDVTQVSCCVCSLLTKWKKHCQRVEKSMLKQCHNNKLLATSILQSSVQLHVFIYPIHSFFHTILIKCVFRKIVRLIVLFIKNNQICHWSNNYIIYTSYILNYIYCNIAYKNEWHFIGAISKTSISWIGFRLLTNVYWYHSWVDTISNKDLLNNGYRN